MFVQMIDIHSLNVSNLFKFDFHFNERLHFAQRWKQGVRKSQASGLLDHLKISSTMATPFFCRGLCINEQISKIATLKF